MIQRGIYILLLISTTIFLCACGKKEVEESPDKANIILIMADDLGFETLGCNGSQDYQTPNLDQLAQDGMRFTHAYSTPLCTPSRVQLMTGKYNFRNYVGFGMLDPQEKTLGHGLGENGYATCVVGKWQLYGNSRQREMFERTGTMPFEAGFDEYCLWQVRDTYGPRFKDPYLEINDTISQAFPGDYGPDRFLNYAMDFISRKKDSAFFLYYPMVLTHDPFQPTPTHPDYKDFDSSTRLNDTTYFRDNVAYMDQLIGKLRRHLEAEGLLDNTLFLFIGDNGTDRDVISTWKGQRIPGMKGYPKEYGTHVPMIAYWEGRIAAGQVNDNLIDFTDFLPTLMEVAGHKNLSTLATDGISFSSQLTGTPQKVREWVFCHYAPQWGNFEHRRYVHDKEWKLFESGEIYHIASDPMEKTPLTVQTIPPDARERMKGFQSILAQMTVSDP